MPDYKTGGDRQALPPPPPKELADADTDTEVALIPITDREGPTREEGAPLSFIVSRGGTAQVRIAGLQACSIALDLV